MRLLAHRARYHLRAEHPCLRGGLVLVFCSAGLRFKPCRFIRDDHPQTDACELDS